MSELPSGTVTFVFTDLEDSTRLWEEHPDAMRVALARHDAILREVVEAHAGTVVKSTGDGAYAVFGVAADAVRAASAVVVALHRAEWAATGPLKARLGVHTGSAEHRDDDYFGPALNRAVAIDDDRARRSGPPLAVDRVDRPRRARPTRTFCGTSVSTGSAASPRPSTSSSW